MKPTQLLRLLDCCSIATRGKGGGFDWGRVMRGVDHGSTRSASRGCLVQPERAPGTYCDKEITETGSSAAVHPMTDCIVQKLCTLAERFIA